MNGPTGPESARRLGDFEILRELGRGGMGIVYEARQISLNRKVALKVLSGGLGLSSKAVVRFRREAEAAARLHHTNIVPVYAIGEQDGEYFYAMELIEGPSLNVVVRELRRTREQALRHSGTEARSDTVETSLPPWLLETLSASTEDSPPNCQHEQAPVSDSSSSLTAGGGYFDTIAGMIAEVADALDYAHEQGVVHRDIKPSNLLLSPDGRLSVNDFGLARMLEQPGMTMTGEFMGSPLYMSPEQITAGRTPLDHRTDIYSLGATLYELLTFQPPFPGERRDQILAQIIHKEPTPPRRLDRKVPIDLETICLNAMEKDPDRRYQTAGQMAEDLRRFVNRFAISAKRAGPIARAVKWVRRRPAIAALIALVLVVSVGGGLMAYRAHVAAEQARRAEGQRALDHAMVAALDGHYDEMQSWLERCEVLDVEPGRIRVLRGWAAVESGAMDEAIHQLELAVEQLPNSLAAHALLSRAFLEAGRIEEAMAVDEKLEVLKPRTPEDYLYGAWALSSSRPRQAREWLEKLAREHPSPAVYYMLGLHLTFEVFTSKETNFEQMLNCVSTAWTQMPENARAGWVFCFAHCLAAEMCAVGGDQARYEYCLDRARRASRDMMERFPDNANARLASAHVALTEGRRNDAFELVRGAIDLPGFWPTGRMYLPAIRYGQGRVDEALRELEAMPAGLKAHWVWPWFSSLCAAELQGQEAGVHACNTWLAEHADLPSDRLYFQKFSLFCLLGRLDEALRMTRKHRDEFGVPAAESPFDHAWNGYMCGDVTDDALLAAAGGVADEYHAHYAIGLRWLSVGDRERALAHFTESERRGASILMPVGPPILLQRMRADPTWPPWIPLAEGTEGHRDGGTEASTQAASAPVGRGP